MASYVASEDFPPKGAREGEALVRRQEKQFFLDLR